MKYIILSSLLLASVFFYIPIYNLEPTSDPLCDYNLFKTVQKIQDIVEKVIDENIANKNISFTQKGRDGWKDPYYYYQTKQGLFLNIIADIPTELYTPWGTVILVGTTIIENPQPLIQKLLEHIKIEQIPVKTSHYGNLFKILAINNQTLSEPILQKMNEYRDINTVNKTWKTLKEHYEKKKIPFYKRFSFYFGRPIAR